MRRCRGCHGRFLLRVCDELLLPLTCKSELTDTPAAHWLAVEGVQPSIPQNPTAADARNIELTAKGPNANPTLAAMSGTGNVAVKPLVKHVLSKELQLYFEKVCNAFLDESSEEYRTAAYASLREDPGLHQLVPYFVQFIAEKVTHSLKDIFVLTQVMHMAEALIQNKSLYVDPYVCATNRSSCTNDPITFR